MLRGRTVTLYEKVLDTSSGQDEFNRPVFTEKAITINNVLIAPVSAEDMLSELNMTGKHAVYQLGIPKGDAHNWANARVEFFGESWRVIGYPTEGQDELIPLCWNRKVNVERWNDG